MTIRHAAAAALVVVAANCSAPQRLPLVDSEAAALGARAIDLVRQGQVDEVVPLFDPTSLPPNGRELIRQTVGILPASGEPQVVQYRFFKSLVHDRLETAFAFHVRGSDSAALVFVSARTESGLTQLTGFRVHPAPVDLADIYPFALAGMQPVHYFSLLAVLAVPLFILFTLVAVVRSRRPHRWLWFIFVLVGFGKFGVQWVAGGRIIVQPLVVQILGASVLKVPIFDPWILAASIPVGAILFWVTNRSRPTPAQPELELESPGDLRPPTETQP
jgi:hypothetical protein